MEKTILVFGRERHTNDGRKFMTYSYVHNNKWYEVKFTQKCTKRPLEKGYFDLTFDTNNIAVETSTRNGKVYQIMWIRDLKNYLPNELKNKELLEKREKALAELFD